MNNTHNRDNTPSVFDVLARLKEQLPGNWRLDLQQEGARPGPDAVYSLEGPDGRRTSLVVEITRRLDPVGVFRVVEQLRSWMKLFATDSPGVSLLVAAPYLGERTRERLRENGLGYLDFTGNTYLRIDEPAVYLSSQGADKDPDRTQRPTRSLRGAKAARIVRTLVDFRSPLGVRQIAEIAQTDAGNVSRLLEMLEKEDLVGRSPRGGVDAVDWEGLLRRWTRDYSLMQSNAYSTYLDPRGLDSLLSRLRALQGEMRYAISGSLAAARLAPVAPARLAVAFVDDAAATAAALGLVESEVGANVMLLEPKGDFVFERTRVDEGLVYVAPSQVVVDLMTGSGRNPAEADAVLEWMRRDEDAWRV